MLTGTAILGTALPWDEEEEVEEKKYGGHYLNIKYLN